MIDVCAGEVSTPAPLRLAALVEVPTLSRRTTSGAVRLDRRTPAFDLAGFGRALEQRDIAYQLACYASDADIRVVDPDNPSTAPRTIRGTDALRSWLTDCSSHSVDVTRLVDGADRVAFAQCWYRPDGLTVVATSTAELCDALISTQHTNLERASSSHVPLATAPAWRSSTARPREVGGGFSSCRDEHRSFNPIGELS